MLQCITYRASLLNTQHATVIKCLKSNLQKIVIIFLNNVFKSGKFGINREKNINMNLSEEILHLLVKLGFERGWALFFIPTRFIFKKMGCQFPVAHFVLHPS